MRGDLVTIAMQGDFGKLRLALVVQANQFSEHASVTVLPVTSTLVTLDDESEKCAEQHRGN